MGRFSALFVIGLLTLCTGGWVFILLVPVFGGFSTWFTGLLCTVVGGSGYDLGEAGKATQEEDYGVYDTRGGGEVR